MAGSSSSARDLACWNKDCRRKQRLCSLFAKPSAMFQNSAEGAWNAAAEGGATPGPLQLGEGCEA